MGFWVEIHELDHVGLGDVGEGYGWIHENTYKTNSIWLKRKKRSHLVKKSVFKSHLNFAQNMDFELKFVKLYHDVLEAVWGVGGQTHQKPLKGSQNWNALALKCPKRPYKIVSLK